MKKPNLLKKINIESIEKSEIEKVCDNFKFIAILLKGQVNLKSFYFCSNGSVCVSPKVCEYFSLKCIHRFNGGNYRYNTRSLLLLSKKAFPEGSFLLAQATWFWRRPRPLGTVEHNVFLKPSWLLWLLSSHFWKVEVLLLERGARTPLWNHNNTWL